MNTAHSVRTMILWWMTLVLGGLLLVGHFTLIQLSNLPTNPVKYQLDDVVTRYVNPLFSQNWSFFAPTPINADDLLYVRGRTDTGQVTSWVDVSDPLVSQMRHNLFTANAEIQLMLSNTVVNYVNSISRDPAALQVLHGKTFWKRVLPPSVNPFDQLIMTRTSTAALRQVYPRLHFRTVQLGLEVVDFPRFNERAKPDSASKRTFTLLHWSPAPEVSSMCCSL